MFKNNKNKVKINRLVSTLIVFSLIFSLNTTILAADKPSDNNTKKIEAVVYNYFKNELESIKNKNIISSKNLNNQILKDYDYSYKKYLSTWYKNIGANLVDYKLYLSVDSVSINEGKSTIYVTKGSDMVFDVSKDIIQKARGDKYKIELEYQDDWLIDNIYYCDPDNQLIAENSSDAINANSVASQLSKYTSVTEYKKFIDNKNINKDKDNIKPKSKINSVVDTNNSLLSVNNLSSYTGWKAASYGMQYSSSYNTPTYPSFSSDCQNFVSQCVKYGGIPTSSSWNCTKGILGGYSYTRSWSLVADFYTYMTSNNYCYITYDSNTPMIGDVIHFYNDYYSDWTHAAIVTAFDSNNNILYSAHTTDRTNYALYNVYPSNYSSVRFLIFN